MFSEACVWYSALQHHEDEVETTCSWHWPAYHGQWSRRWQALLCSPKYKYGNILITKIARTRLFTLALGQSLTTNVVLAFFLSQPIILVYTAIYAGTSLRDSVFLLSNYSHLWTQLTTIYPEVGNHSIMFFTKTFLMLILE